MKVSDIRGMSVDELNGELDKLRQKLFDVRCQAATENLSDTSQKRQIRQDIARVMTVMRQRELAQDSQTAAE